MNKKSFEFQATISGDGYGYVYVMSYPGSDKVKIGHSTSPQIRASDIGGTLAPESPVLEAYFWCSERRADVERAAHRIEKENRANGEWFRISISQAMNAIRLGAKEVEVGIQLVFERANQEESPESTSSKPNGDFGSNRSSEHQMREIAAKRKADREAALAEQFWLSRTPEGIKEAIRAKEAELEAERVRLEKVRQWKLDEPNRLQRIFERGLKR